MEFNFTFVRNVWYTQFKNSFSAHLAPFINLDRRFAPNFTPPTACRATAFHSAAFKRRRSNRKPGSGRQIGESICIRQLCELLTLGQP